MAVASERLAGPMELAGGADVSVLTVPDARRCIVKNLRLVNTLGADTTVRVCLNAIARGNALMWDTVIPAGEVISDTSWWVMDEGEQLFIRTPDDEALTVMASGALLRLGL